MSGDTRTDAPPPYDGNPDRIRCVICGDTAGPLPRREMVIGQVCGVCLGAAAMESAPYWADRDKENARYWRKEARYAAFDRKALRQAAKRKEARL